MNNDAERSVSEFYNTVGWQSDGRNTEDARRWEDLRENSKEYVSKCRLRLLRHIPTQGEFLLDMASGPIQYDEYLQYSRGFKKRYCVDLSAAALDVAKERIGDHGVFLLGSFLDLPLEENFFDCVVSLHTIYHIHSGRQEEAVRKLVAVTKPGKPIIIVYSNPRTLLSMLRVISPVRIVKRLARLLKGKTQSISGKASGEFYFFAHPISWWSRFSDTCTVRILPWRSMDAGTQKRVVPDNVLGSKLLEGLFAMEDAAPWFFSRYFQYPMIILVKLPGTAITNA